MAVQYLDIVRHDVTMAANRLDMETQAVFSAVQNLYGMTFSSRGRDAVVAVVTMGDNADSIIALTKHTSEDGKKDMKKSAVRGFASEILLMVIRSSDNVEFMKKYCTQLLTIGSSDSHSKLSELVGWCSPAADPVVFTQAGVPVLANIVKLKVEKSEEQEKQQQTKTENILCSELVTSVRLLQHQVSPWAGPGQGQRTKSRQVMNQGGYDGLKMDASYRQVQQIKLFSPSKLRRIISNFSVPKLPFQVYHKLTIINSYEESVIKEIVETGNLRTFTKLLNYFIFVTRVILMINIFNVQFQVS